MASDYGPNFGFRVSDETRRSSMGRVKTPATGAILLQGTAVAIDATNAGFLRVATANEHPRTGTCGLLIQEESWNRTVYETSIIDSYALSVTKPNTLSVITNGPGTKVWFRNSTTKTRADGRVITGVTMFNPTGVAVGQGLAWNGTTWVNVAAPDDPTSFMEVVYFDSARAYLEAVLTH
jgi:hypothetical protein